MFGKVGSSKLIKRLNPSKIGFSFAHSAGRMPPKLHNEVGEESSLQMNDDYNRGHSGP